MSDDAERERAKYEALAALVDGYRRERDDAREQLYMTKRELGRWVDRETKAARERDEARREADRFRHGCTVESDFVCPNEYAVSELTAERNFLRALKKNHEEDFTRVCKERDEARAEVERLRVELIRAGSRECDIAACNCGTWHHQNPRAAYRRGAEAMREACARWMSEREGISQWVYDDALSALPIPEDM